VAEPIPHTDRITSAQFSPDGSRVLTAAVDGTTQIWSLPRANLDDADWLVEIGEALARRIVLPDGRETALSPLEYQQKLQDLRWRHADNEFVARFFRP
jgi:WD40 repeat protein